MTDTELRPVAQDLLETVRLAQTPSDAQRERAYQALIAGLSGGAIAGAKAISASKVASTASSFWLKWAAFGVILASASAGTVIWAKHRHALSAVASSLHSGTMTASATATTDDSSAPMITTPSPSPLVSSAAPVPSATPSASTKSSLATKPKSDDLAGDVSLLHDALAASHSGNAAHALELAQQHARLYPNSRLSVERGAIEVRSLCALGRAAEARKLAAHLRTQVPNSPVNAALEETCVGQ